MKKTKIAVAMSGGVDSSVAAAILKEHGHEIVGVTMKVWDCGDDAAKRNKLCCSLRDLDDARYVADKLKIPHYVLDVKPDFEKYVIDPFCRQYLKGKTPNPCVLCNKKIKFDILLNKVKSIGFSNLATGHYAQIVSCKIQRDSKSPINPSLQKGETCLTVGQAGGFSKKSNEQIIYQLKCGVDKTKDQSYWLYTLTQPVLPHIIFPLGKLKKQQVRKIANKLGLNVAEKAESQEICFITKGKYSEFIEKWYTSILHNSNENTTHLSLRAVAKQSHFLVDRLPRPDTTSGLVMTEKMKYDLGKGDIINANGKILGKHKGIIYYTIGQRHGLGISAKTPLYITKIDLENNRIVVGTENELYFDNMTVENINWINATPPKLPLKCKVKIRYQHKPTDCVVERCSVPTLVGTRYRNNCSDPFLNRSDNKSSCLKTGRYKVVFNQPQRAVTPGQSAVFYKNSFVLGGGIIE